MTSKLVVNTIEADTGISSVSFASSISMSSTSKFHFSAVGIDIDADTNINRPSAGVLGFNINDSQKVVITSNGRLGIGTNNPQQMIEVQDRSGGTLIGLSVGTQYGNASFGGYNNYPAIMNNASQPLIYCDTNNDRTVFFGDTVGFGTTCAFRVNGAERLRITSAGYLKLGSTDGGAWHTIRLNTTTNNAIKDVLNIHSSVDGATAAAGVGVRLNFFGEQLNGNEYIYGSIAGLLSSSGSGYGDLAFYTNNNGTNTERLRITSAGLVGIATNAPSAAFLDIASSQPTDSLRMRRLSSDSNVASNWSMKPYGGNLYFRSGGSSDRIYFDDSGDLYIMDGDLKIATSGHGIDFSATANGASGSYLNSEVLSDYERGRFEPRFLENGTTDSNYAWRYGQYVKIGNIVHVHMAFGISSLSGNFTTAFIGGLPFTMSSQWGTADFSYVHLVGYSYASGYGDSGNTTQISMELNQTHGTMHRVVQGQGKSNVNQSSIGGSQRFAFQFSYPTAP